MHYRVNFLDSSGNVTSTFELGCPNDERAIAFVSEIKPDYAMELWHSDRLVTRREAERTAG